MNQQGLANAVANRRARIQRGKRVLKDDLHFAAQRFQLRAFRYGNVAIFKFDGAAGRVQQADQQPAHRRFAATRFAHQSQRFAAFHDKADVLNGLHLRHRAHQHAAAHGKILNQVFDFNQDLGQIHSSHHSSLV